jgi:RNA 2',3'-cyclic 3'-phosphodiesterase
MAQHERLFIALWPDAEVRSEIAAAIAGLESSGRVIAAHNLHVTLVFLGACDAARRECVEHAAARVSAEAFELVFTRVEWRRRGGIVWLATSDVPATLVQSVAALNAAFESCGHTPESRSYRPHVTIARNARQPGRARAIPRIAWQVRDYCLISSRPGAGGSHYTVERRWPLAGADR